MRLIDADVLIAHIDEIYKGYMTDECGCVPCDFEKIVDEQPTAYDIDKVVEELNDLVIPIDKKQTRIPLDRAIEIVKRGGKNDDWWIYRTFNRSGRAEGYSKAENDYFAQSQKDREDTYNCGYAIGRQDALDELKGKKDEIIRWLIKRDKEGYGTTNGELLDHILEVSEQLKEYKWQ